MWFKIVLLVWCAGGVLAFLARLGGWKPTPSAPLSLATSAIVYVLLFVGIWHYF